MCVRNNWDKYVTFYKKNCENCDNLSCFLRFTRIYLKNDNWKSQMNSKTIHIQKFVMITWQKKSFYCTVCLSVTSLTHTSEEAKDLLEYDSKDESLKFHFSNMFCDYVMFLFRNKRCIQAIFNLFGLVTLHLLISWYKNLTNMFVVSISTLYTTYIN